MRNMRPCVLFLAGLCVLPTSMTAQPRRSKPRVRSRRERGARRRRQSWKLCASTSNGRERTYRNRVRTATGVIDSREECLRQLCLSPQAMRRMASTLIICWRRRRCVSVPILCFHRERMQSDGRDRPTVCWSIYNAETGAELGTITAHPAATDSDRLHQDMATERAQRDSNRAVLLPYSLDEKRWKLLVGALRNWSR